MSQISLPSKVIAAVGDKALVEKIAYRVPAFDGFIQLAACGQKVRSHAQARNLDERHAAVENDPGGIRSCIRLNSIDGCGVPTQPYHHDLAPDPVRAAGRRYIGNRSDCHYIERVVVRGCYPARRIRSSNVALRWGVTTAQVVGGAAVNKSLRVHVQPFQQAQDFFTALLHPGRRAR